MRLKPRVRLAVYAAVAGLVALSPSLMLGALALGLLLPLLAPFFPLSTAPGWTSALLSVGDAQPAAALRALPERPSPPSRLTSHAAAAAAFLGASLAARAWVVAHRPALFNHFLYVTLRYHNELGHDPSLRERFTRWLFGLNAAGHGGYSLGPWDDAVIGAVLTGFAIGLFEAAVALAFWRFPGWFRPEPSPHSEG